MSLPPAAPSGPSPGERARPTGRAVGRAVVGVALAVVVVGLVARSPTTTAPPPLSTPTAVATADPVDPAEPDLQDRIGDYGGTWTTVGTRAPLTQLTPAPGVWTGRELVVGFAPDVVAFDPSTRLWRAVGTHPNEPLEVRGAVADGDAIYVYGAKPCPGCPWQSWLHHLDLASSTWERLPDAPGDAEQDDAAVLLAGDRLVVVRDRGPDASPQVLAYDPSGDGWTDLAMPDVGPLRWQAAAVGERVVVAGVTTRRGGAGSPGALVHDPVDGWRDATVGIPLLDPHLAAVVATADGQAVFFGASAGDGAPRGAVLDTRSGRWRALPEVPDDPVLPAEEPRGPLNGLSGAWDGTCALFAGGLPRSRYLAWCPDEDRWHVRLPPAPRAGTTAVWTGRQLLLWGGVDRAGQSLELQAWPVRPD